MMILLAASIICAFLVSTLAFILMTLLGLGMYFATDLVEGNWIAPYGAVPKIVAAVSYIALFPVLTILIYIFALLNSEEIMAMVNSTGSLF